MSEIYFFDITIYQYINGKKEIIYEKEEIATGINELKGTISDFNNDAFKFIDKKLEKGERNKNLNGKVIIH